MRNYQDYTGDQLLESIQNNDLDAFAVFFERYREILFNKANKRLKDSTEAQEVVQVIFIWIWNHRHQIDIKKGVQAYLNGAVKNQTADLIRKKTKRRQQEVDYMAQQETINSISPLELKELGIQLLLAIDTITPDTRKMAFKKSFLENKNLKQIAFEMETSVQSVKNHIHRAVKHLRKNIPKK